MRTPTGPLSPSEITIGSNLRRSRRASRFASMDSAPPVLRLVMIWAILTMSGARPQYAREPRRQGPQAVVALDRIAALPPEASSGGFAIEQQIDRVDPFVTAPRGESTPGPDHLHVHSHRACPPPHSPGPLITQ